MAEKSYSEYAERNGGPILEVLRSEFVSQSNVLEIGSGTGQHAVKFAAAMPHLRWQTSDREENHAGISAWVEGAALLNLLPPLSLDVLINDVPAEAFDAVFSANTAHIMSTEAVTRMFDLIGKAMTSGGVFCLYGPFRQDMKFNAESNAKFHDNLRSRDPAMGIRDIEWLDSLGRNNRLFRTAFYAMPANNNIAVWVKGS